MNVTLGKEKIVLPPKLAEAGHSFVTLLGKIYKLIDEGRLSEDQTRHEKRADRMIFIFQAASLLITAFLLINTIACMGHR